MKMVINILGIGSIIENKVKESLSLLMVISMSVNTKTTNRMDKAHVLVQTEQYFKKVVGQTVYF